MKFSSANDGFGLQVVISITIKITVKLLLYGYICVDDSYSSLRIEYNAKVLIFDSYLHLVCKASRF